MSVSSPRLLLVSLAISMAAAVPIIPVSEITLVSATGFYMINTEEVWMHVHTYIASPVAAWCI